MQTKVIDPWTWQAQYSFVQGREVSRGDRVLYCAGQTSVDDDGNPIHEGDIRAQLARAFDNLETVLDRAGMDLGNVVRLNYYTTDVDGLLGCFDVVSTRLSGSGTAVASTLLGVERLAIPTLLVELEATAVA